MINKMQKFASIILPFIIVWFAFSKGGLQLGFLVSLALIIINIVIYLPNIYVSLANFNYKKNNQKTFQYLEKAYKTGKMKPKHILYYSYLCLRECKTDKAERLLNVIFAHKRSPEIYNQARINLSILLWKQNKLDGAIALLEDTIKEYKSSIIYGNLGYFLILKGEYKKALDFNLEAYDYNQEDAVISDNLAQSYYYMGLYQKSEEIYEELMKKNPQFPIPHYNYAKTLYAQGKKEKAAEQARLALSFPFTNLIDITPDDVLRFLETVENEL